MNSKKIFASLAVAMLPYLAVAQDAARFLNGVQSEMNGITQPVKTVSMIFIGVLGTIYTAINVAKYFGDQGGDSRSLLRVVIGIVVSLVLIAAISLIPVG